MSLSQHTVPLFFICSVFMELRGIEPLSESLFIQASSITVALLTFPPEIAEQQALPFSSFIKFSVTAKLRQRSFPYALMPGSLTTGN